MDGDGKDRDCPTSEVRIFTRAGGLDALLRMDFDAGHGIGSTRAQLDREGADTCAFLLSQSDYRISSR
jgi:protease II